MTTTYQTPSRYAYNQQARNWLDAMIEARNDGRPYSWI